MGVFAEIFSDRKIARQNRESTLGWLNNNGVFSTSGSDVLLRISPKMEDETGVRSAGLRTKGHPLAMAGPIL